MVQLNGAAFSDPRLAELYDDLNPWNASDEYFLSLVLDARAVLDVGCGTGMLLRRAREMGHRGRLCGVDPALAMLELAAERTDIEWVLGDCSQLEAIEEFDLVTLTSRSFQFLVSDADVALALRTIHRALRGQGRLAFEVSHPQAHPWTDWTPSHAREVTGANGAVVRVEPAVDMPVVGDIVHFTEVFSSASWPTRLVSRGSLRFYQPDALVALLEAGGFSVLHQFGDAAKHPIDYRSTSIISIATRSS